MAAILYTFLSYLSLATIFFQAHLQYSLQGFKFGKTKCHWIIKFNYFIYSFFDLFICGIYQLQVTCLIAIDYLIIIFLSVIIDREGLKLGKKIYILNYVVTPHSDNDDLHTGSDLCDITDRFSL